MSNNSEKPGSEGFSFGYESMYFGQQRVLVPVSFAEELRTLRNADGELDAGDGDREDEATVGDEALSVAGGSWPGLGLAAGSLPAPSPVDDAVVNGRGRVTGLAASLVDAEVRFPIRLCTPAVLPEVAELIAGGLAEMSVSVDSFGSHLSGVGPLGGVARVAAVQRGAKGALMSVTGCTGANRVAVGMVARAFPGRPIAIPVNAHHSVLNAAQALGVPVVFITGQRMLAAFEAVLPPTAADVDRVLQSHPEVAAVWVTSPSYEGVVASIAEIAEVVHRSDLQRLLVVDQAWGAHLGFSSATPPSAIRWADVVCESTHKQGGAPNQAGVLLWAGDRIDEDLLSAVYRSEVTTSPSFPLLAATEHALSVLGSPRGRAHVRRVSELSADLAAGVRELGFSVLDGDRVGSDLDPMKLALSTDGSGWSGYGLAQFLAERGIVVERAGLRSVVMIVGYTLTRDDVATIVAALQAAIYRSPGFDTATAPMWAGHPETGIIDLTGAILDRNRLRVAVGEAVGMVAAEMVECYPPGIAVIVPGMTITADAVAYLDAVQHAGGSVVGSDSGHQTVLVTPATRTATIPA